MVLFGAHSSTMGIVSWFFFNLGEEIIAKTKLVNKCQLDTKYFIVRDLESGKSAAVINGFAKLTTKTKLSLQQQLLLQQTENEVSC